MVVQWAELVPWLVVQSAVSSAQLRAARLAMSRAVTMGTQRADWSDARLDRQRAAVRGEMMGGLWAVSWGGMWAAPWAVQRVSLLAARKAL